MSEAETRTNPPPSGTADGAAARRRRLIGAAVVASAVFLVLEFLDSFVAVPLRELSSILVELVMSLVGFPVTRNGTILVTPDLTFDVVPACSGSTTLRVLLFVTIVWCGIHPRLSGGRRVAAMLLAVPLAVAANAMRVASLVFMGHLARTAPGEFLHVLTGLVAFAVSMAASFALADRLATTEAAPAGAGRGKAVVLAALLLFLFTPFLMWCLQAWWVSPLDRFGFVFVALAGAWGTWQWIRTPSERGGEGVATAGFGASLVFLLGATLADVNILKGMALLGVLISLAAATRGLRFARAALPLFGIGYLGFPTVSYQLQAVTLPLFGTGSLVLSLVVKGVLTLLLAGATILTFRRAAPSEEEPSGVRFQHLRLLAAALLAAFQAYFYSTAAGEMPLSRLEMSYLQGDWVGRNHRISRAGEEAFRERLWSRQYARGSEAVDVLVTSTGGDRHRAHPPEYCMTGGGWKVVEREVSTQTVGGEEILMTRLRLLRGGVDMDFCYWFTDGTRSFSTYAGMLTEDMVRRLAGRRTDWFLFRVMTLGGANSLEVFLEGFDARVEEASED